MSLLEAAVKRIGTHHQDLPVQFSVLDDETLLCVVQAPPRGRLRLCAESEFTTQLDGLGILEEAEIGEDSFDASYVIREGEPGQAAQLLSPPVRSLIRALEPFLEFEMTAREYRLLKKLKAAELPGVLDRLVEITRLTQA